jgi:hypothetical protein
MKERTSKNPKSKRAMERSATFRVLRGSLFASRAPLKTPKSRLATEAKAEFTKANEHFADGA